MRSVPIPQISVDALSYLKPELIGLAAWLGINSQVWGSDRNKVLEHAAKTGSLDGLSPGLLTEANLDCAKAAHGDWLDYLAAIDPHAGDIVFRRNGNGAVHRLPDPTGFNGQEHPDDVTF